MGPFGQQQQMGGTLQGTIQGIAIAQGIVRLGTQQGIIELRATPAQLIGLNPGDTVTARYQVIGNQPWVVPFDGQTATSRLGPQAVARQGAVTGVISNIDPAQGIVLIRGRPFFTHPQVLMNLTPGQPVSVRFEQLQNVSWITGISPADPAEIGRDGGQRGTVQGVVGGVDYGRGLAQIIGEQGIFVLHASPDQLADLTPADQVSLDFADHAGHLWITDYDVEGARAVFRTTDRVTGQVTNVDHQSGIIIVRGQPLRAHPEVLQQVTPGQTVEVSYGQLQNVPWVVTLEPVRDGRGEIGLDQQQRGQRGQLQTIRGTIGETRTFRGRNVAELETEEGEVLLLDLGQQDLGDLGLREGARVQIRGRLEQVGGETLLRAEGLDPDRGQQQQQQR
ncbi:MAG: hypothetical protein KF878_21060 [Planctomycetes bacterium]|nr:hypothetical protein [Planctomycetota bacterium]